MLCEEETDFCVRLQANLLSSHRSLVHRVETIALGDKPCDRGEHVTLFLFNDCLEVKLSLSLSLHHNCSSECVYGDITDVIPPPPLFFIMQMLHQLPKSSTNIWKTLVLISGLVYGVFNDSLYYVKLLARFSLYCYYYTHIAFKKIIKLIKSQC